MQGQRKTRHMLEQDVDGDVGIFTTKHHGFTLEPEREHAMLTSFLGLEPRIIAEQLTLTDAHLFNSVRSVEFHEQVRCAPEPCLFVVGLFAMLKPAPSLMFCPVEAAADKWSSIH